MQPLVSCLITSYNYAHLIERAIESALAQDYGAEHLEIVIVDDGSTDETAAVVAPYLGKRVRFVVKENGGLTSSANRAMAEARGEFLAFLDADDEWAPDNVSRKMEVMLARPEVGLVYSDLETIDAEGALLEPSYFGMLGLTAPRSPEFLGAQLVRNYPVSGSILLRASLVPRFAPVDETLIVHDWPISNAIAQLAAVELVDAPLVRYRQHGANMNLGIGGEVRRHISGGENEIRRRALAAVRPGQAADGHLVEAIVQLDHVYAEVGDPAAWVTVTDAQRVLAAEAVAEGRAALAEGDVHRALTRLVNAVAHDPLANDARLVLQELLNGPLGAGAPADGAARAFAVLAFADELLERPELLGAYCEVFGPADDATLIIYAPGWDAEQAGTRLPALLTAAGRADRPGPDIRAMPVAHPDPVQEEGLARAVRAVLTETRPQDAFAGVPAFTAATAPQLRVLADLLRAPAA